VRAGALVLAVLAASGWPPWRTIAQHNLTHGPRQRAFVAGSLDATHAFAVFLPPEDRAALASVYYRTEAVVAVFRTVPSTGFTLEIRSMRRRGSRLTIVVALRQPTASSRPWSSPPAMSSASEAPPRHAVASARRREG
jgi:hypothetical protein